MTINLEWQHSILLIGALFSLLPWRNYNSNGDTMGIGGLIAFAGSTIIALTTLCVYFSLGYFGVF